MRSLLVFAAIIALSPLAWGSDWRVVGSEHFIVLALPGVWPEDPADIAEEILG